MIRHSVKLAAFAALAAVLLPAPASQAQYYGGSYAQPAPLYPYAVQRNQPYAVQVAPDTYVTRRSAPTRDYPYVSCQNCRGNAAHPVARRHVTKFDRPHKPVDRALIEELRQRSQSHRDQPAPEKTKRDRVNKTVINTTRIVHDAPVVVETERVVDDPPRVIERRHVAEDKPVRSHRKPAAGEERASKAQVIQADAEVTILGPDRMSIRLFRKGQGPKASARAP